MADYYIEWRIEIDAESPEEAARHAEAIHRDPHSIARVYHVYADDNGESVVIDLDALDQVTGE